MAPLTAPASGPVGAPPPAVTLSELAEYLRTDVGPDLQGPLSSALDVVERRCGPIVPGQRTYAAAVDAGCVLRLPVRGQRIVSVDMVTDPAGTEVAPVTVDWWRGVITLPVSATTAPAGRWLVTVTATRDPDTTMRLIEAVLIIAKHLHETRRGVSARPQVYDGSPAETPPGRGFAIPRRALELMRGLKATVRVG